MKRTVALLLSAVMILSFSGCAGKGESDSKADLGVKDAQPQETPEFVYTSTFSTIADKSDESIVPLAVTEKGFYSTYTETVGENIPEGKTAEYEGQYDITEPRIIFVDNEGKISKLEKYTPVKTEIEELRDFSSSQYISGMAVSADGEKLIVLETVFSSWSDAPENVEAGSDEYDNYYNSKEARYLRVLDRDGKELSSAEFELPDGVNFYNDSYYLDEKGNLVTYSDSKIYAFDMSGKTVYTADSGGYIYSMAKLRDGRLAVLAMDMGNYSLTLKTLDGKDGSFESKSFNMPLSNTFNLVTGGGEYDFYYTSGIKFFGYSLAEEKAVPLFSWLDCDVREDDLKSITVNENGDITGYISEQEGKADKYKLDRVTISKVPSDSVVQKEILTLAALYLDENAQKAVIDFNRKNEKYRISVKDYSEFNTENDYSAGLTKLTTEIMAGNVPDIISVSSEMPYRQMAAKGLLEDLYPYIENDREFNLSDFFENVLSAMEVNGKLYAACSGFGVVTAVGASSVVGDTPGWTYDDYEKALAKMPENCEGFDLGFTKEDMLNYCMALDADLYMDWATGKCSFDSQEFIKLLEFCNKLPSKFDFSTVEQTPENGTSARVARGAQMLATATFTSTDFFMYDYDKLFGGKSTMIGFPTSSGVGSMFIMADSFAMSSKCSNKDAAWTFLREFLGEEYQKDTYYLPTNKNVFEKKLKESMVVEYEKDANGNYRLDENGEKIPQSKGGFSNGLETFSIYATTPQQAEQLRLAISTTTKMMNYDMSIINIVAEGAKPFFEGQKSAQEAAKIIQSKANIYINEQR